jgi:TPR repeat protein
VAYSAPESQSGVVSKASDWWSVGVVVLELLTGRGAFEGLDERTINFTLATKGIEIPETLPGEWRALLAGLLCQDDSRRWGWEELSDWMAGKELPPPLVARGGGRAAAAPGGEPQAAIPYRFKGEAYATAMALARALAENWEDGVKHFGRGLILEWLKNDLKDAEKVVQVSDLAENGKLTPEMKFAAALLVLDPKMPLSWRGEVVDEAFAHSNGELLWSMVEAGMLGVLGELGFQNDALEMVARRMENFLKLIFLKLIKSHHSIYDLHLAKKIIGAPESRIQEEAMERASVIFGSMKENQTLPQWTGELPEFNEWFLGSSLGLMDGLELLSCKKNESEKVFLPCLQTNAFRWCLERAEAQEAKWQERVAWMYQHGWGVAKDEAAAAGWLGALASQGNSEAQGKLGEIFKDGIGVEQSDTEAVRWFGAAAVQGNANAQYWLGWMIANARGTAQDDDQAAGWFYQAAQQGDARAQYELGQMYYHGRGVVQSNAYALEWFSSAAERGNVFAQILLGIEGVMCKELSAEQRLNLLYQGDQLGILDSQYMIGCLLEASGKKKDSFKWYYKSANSEHAAAQYMIGIIYKYCSEDYGVPQDKATAFQWYLKSATNGCELAYFYVAMSYYYGDGVEKNFSRAFNWYLKDAETGCSTSQYHLGEMFEKGEGVQRDLAKAIEWYEKASVEGNEDAKKSLSRLKKRQSKRRESRSG